LAGLAYLSGTARLSLLVVGRSSQEGELVRGAMGGLLASLIVTVVLAGIGAVWAQASNDQPVPENSVVNDDPPDGMIQWDD
jgi:hypothetical protein